MVPRFKSIITLVHLWSGLLAAPLLLMLGLTGSYLTFEYQFDHLLNPKLNYVAVKSARVPLEQLVAAAQAAHPAATVTLLTLSPYSTSPDLAYTALMSQPGHPDVLLYLDPYTAHVLGERRSMSFSTGVHELHTNLLTGEGGHGGIVLVVTVVLLILLSISGVILWWPRKIITVNWKASGKRVTFDLHNAVGFFSFAFMLLFAVTGIIIHGQYLMLPAADRMLHIRDAEPDLRIPSPPGAPPHIPLDEVVRRGEQAAPGARVTQIRLPAGTPTAGVRTTRLWLKYPEDGTPLGRSAMQLDPWSGAVLWMRTSRNAHTTTRFFRQWNRELHTGDILGWPTRILMCVMSLALPVLAITGPLFWIRRRGWRELIK